MHRILIELRYRGSAIENAYTDGEGRFGFSNLVGGEYHIVISDELFEPVDERVMVNPDVAPSSIVQIALRPRENAHVRDPAGTRIAGSNPSLIDLSEYNQRFPKKAVKEYDKGFRADKESKRDEAIPHYEAALKIAPDYYPAHNNLGSDYLSKSDFTDAHREFEDVMRLNPGDAAAYFNLANVCMLMGQLEDAQQYLSDGMRRQPDSALGHFLVGSLDMRLGKYDQAEEALRNAIRLSPVMAQARLQLVNLMLQRGRKSDAVAELRAFVTVLPQSPFTPKAKQTLEKLTASDTDRNSK